MAEWFEEISNEIVVNGNSLCHLHRAHRLAAIKYLKETVPDMEMLFDSKVMLRLWVKVKSGWSDDERALRSLGYDDV